MLRAASLDEMMNNINNKMLSSLVLLLSASFAAAEGVTSLNYMQTCSDSEAQVQISGETVQCA